MRIICGICKELFIPNVKIFLIKCGHLYHEDCINIWLGRNSTCPDCRAPVKDKPLRVYPAILDRDDVMKQYCAEAIEEIQSLQDELIATKEKLKDSEERKLKLDKELADMKASLEEVKVTVKNQRDKITSLIKENKLLDGLSEKNLELQYKLDTFSRLDIVLNGSKSEASALLSRTPVTPLAVHQLCVYVEALKWQLDRAHEKYKKEVKQLEYEYTEKTETLKKKTVLSEKKDKSVNAAISLKPLPECPEKTVQKRKVSDEDSSDDEKKEKLENLLNGKSAKPKKAKVINLLEKKVLPKTSVDSDDDEVPVFHHFSKIQADRSMNARENSDIFAKFKEPNGGRLSVSKVSPFCRNEWRTPKSLLCSPNSLEENHAIRMKYKTKKGQKK